MRDGPQIAGIAALIGDHARAEVLTTLMSGQALTATELADVAGVTKPTISAHLGKMVDARLLAVESQGRHRYFRLADPDVARLLESLMGVADRTGAVRRRASPREPALRRSRVCYDHLAGEFGVKLFEALLQRTALRREEDGLVLTVRGQGLMHEIGIDAQALASQRRVLCRACLDWSERRHHLAGALGAALFARLQALGWARRAKGSRVVQITPPGEQALARWLEQPLT
jgi:DNA-binding transcriptional ArsR family regulator